MEMTFRMGKFSLNSRLILFSLSAAAGIAIQFLLLATESGFLLSFIPGAIVLVVGFFPLRAKGYTNRPEDLGYEDWQPATEEEVRRIAANFRLTKKVRIPLYYRRGAGLIFAFPLTAFAVFLAFSPETRLISLFLLDAVLIFLPVLFFGHVSLFVPGELKMKLDTFQSILDDQRHEGTVLTPYLRLDKDREGRRIPEDIRFMLEPRRKPGDFSGVQFQVAINNGPNGKVPYLYAVFLTQGPGRSFKALSRANFGRFLTEEQPSSDYSTIVVRQQTSGTGYHTTDSDCRELYHTVLRVLEAALPS